MKSILLLALAAVSAAATLEARQSGSEGCRVVKTSGSTCNVAGAPRTPNVLRRINNVTQQQCSQALDNSPKANSAMFNNGGDESLPFCVLYKTTIRQQGGVVAGNGRLYDKACLRCKTCKLGFKNGGFDTGSLSPWKADYTSGQVAISVVSGGYDNTPYAAQWSFQQDQGNIDILQRFAVCPNQQYQVSFYYKSYMPINDSSLYLVAGYKLPDREVNAISTGSFSGDWEEATFTYTPPRPFSSIYIDVSQPNNLTSNAMATLLVDDVVVKAV